MNFYYIRKCSSRYSIKQCSNFLFNLKRGFTIKLKIRRKYLRLSSFLEIISYISIVTHFLRLSLFDGVKFPHSPKEWNGRLERDIYDSILGKMSIWNDLGHQSFNLDGMWNELELKKVRNLKMPHIAWKLVQSSAFVEIAL